MLTPDAIDECTSILTTLTKAMGGVLVAAAGVPAATLKYGLSDLLSNADYLIRDGTVMTAIVNLFSIAYAAGATITTIEAVRVAMVALNPVTTAGILVAVCAIQCALAIEVTIYAATVFVSRQDVDAALVQINAAFMTAEQFSADNHDPASYQALVAAHASCVTDLSTRCRPLPQMITYNVGTIMTSYALAQRLYADPSRADQIVAENQIAFAAFMPSSGVALSS